MNNRFGTIIEIGDILVSEEVVTEFFVCDYETCRGVCCIEGDSGAPMEEIETETIERDYPGFCDEMTQAGRDAVDAKGFFEIDRDGDIVTPLVEGSCECAFCHFGPSGEALCAIEKCGLKKPVSCSLYPIRVTKFKNGGLALNLHRWDICKCAFEKGKKEKVRVYEFLKKPLTDNFGSDFYEALDSAAKHLLAD